MADVIAFETKHQKEAKEIFERAEENHKAFDEMMEKKERKLQMKGSLTEADIEEIFKGLSTITRDSKEIHEHLRKGNPEAAEETERLKKEACQKAKEEFYEKEFGLKAVK